MKWTQGAPNQIYILVINETGKIYYFETTALRTAFIVTKTPTYKDGTYTFRTYIQKGSK